MKRLQWIGPLFVALVVVALTSTSWAAEVRGDQSGTWTLAGSPYVVTANITVPAGQTLTIEPGVIVKFTRPYGVNYTGFTVGGTLEARGTASNPIVFTAYSHDIGGDTNGDGTETTPAPGDWVHISFSDGSSGILDHCKVLYASVGIKCYGNASPTISNCEIAYSNRIGIELFNSACPMLKNNTFSHNNGWPVVLKWSNMPVFEGNKFESNGHDGVLVPADGTGYVTVPEGEQVTWSNPGVPYVTDGRLTVEAGATLTLAPGVIVKFTIPYGVNYRDFRVFGTLDAQGTASEPIVFTAFSDDIGGDTNEDGTETTPAPGDWIGIIFSDGSSGILDYCKVLYARIAIKCSGNASPTISNSELAYSNGNGIELSGSASPVLKNNTFSHNNGWPVVLKKWSTMPVFEGNRFESNGHDGVLIPADGAGYVTVPEGEQVTWNNPGIPYVITGRLGVKAGATLTLPPGLIVKFTDVDFRVTGTLEARGTASEPIVFTSLADDIGGDTNGDGTETTPVPGDWVRIVFSEESKGVLDHCKVLYAGSGTSYRGAINCYASPTISNCEIAYSAGNGIEVYDPGAPTLNPNNIFRDFDGFGVYNKGSATVNACNNWWGDASGPYHETLNPDGQGIAVSDNVTFDPWLKAVPVEPITDTTPPVITSGLTVSDITSTSAVVMWVTDEASNSVVEYGATTAYGLLATGAEGTDHNVPLTGLSASTTYHYRVGSTDASGNATWSEDYTFTTTAPYVPEEFVLVGTDADDDLKMDIKQVFASSDADVLSFKVTTHRPWEKDMVIVVNIDADQDLNTGDPENGVDYWTFALMEDGDVSGGLFAYVLAEEDFIFIGELADVICEANSDVCQFSVMLGDIGSPDAVDFDVMVGEDLDFVEVDFAPDVGFYTYTLGEVPTVTVGFSTFHNSRLQDMSAEYPEGDVILASIPFSIPTGGNNMWSSSYSDPNPHQIDISVGVSGVSKVYTLINSAWGQDVSKGSFAAIEFYGSDGAFLGKDLYGNADIRDYYSGNWTNSINGTTTINVFKTSNGQFRLDMQTIDLPDDFLSQTLETIRVIDTGGQNIQRIFLAGITVESVAPAEPVADTTPPVITSGPTVSDITSTSAVVTWDTDEASSSVVEYGAKPEYGLTAEGEDSVTEHSVSLTSLSPNTTYYYRVGSTDASDNTVWSEQKTFETIAEVVAERTLSITSVEASPGAHTTVQLSITDATGISAGDILVKYDADVITVGQVKGTDLISGITLIINKDTLGEITFSMAGAQGIPSGSGALIEIGLTVSENAEEGTETTLELVATDTELYDESGEIIPINLENGVVKIAQAGIKGDVNNDGRIRSNDALLALRIAAGLMEPTDYQKWAADMNSDGRIRANDALLILRKAAGLAAPDIQPIAAAGETVTVMLRETHGVAGESITVPLNVDNIHDLSGGDIRLCYDSEVLRAVEVTTKHDLVLVSNIAESGVVQIAFATADRMSNKTVAEIRFDILADDVSALTLQRVELYRSDAQLVDSRKIDSQFSSWAIPPEHSALLQNFPNPFNPDTWIPYQLKEGSEVTIRIYSVSGELVRTLELGNKAAGLYVSRDRATRWDGRNKFGALVASGLYFYSIRAGDFSAVRKLIILK